MKNLTKFLSSILLFIVVSSIAFAKIPDCQPMRFNRLIEGKKIVLVLCVMQTGNNFTIYDSLGNNYKTVNREGLILYVEELRERLQKGINKAYEAQKKINTLIIQNTAKRLGMNEEGLNKLLNQGVPENPKITYRELFQMPSSVVIADFIPSEIYFGGDVYLPVSIPLDGDCNVVAHELFHYRGLTH